MLKKKKNAIGQVPEQKKLERISKKSEDLKNANNNSKHGQSKSRQKKILLLKKKKCGFLTKKKF